MFMDKPCLKRFCHFTHQHMGRAKYLGLVPVMLYVTGCAPNVVITDRIEYDYDVAVPLSEITVEAFIRDIPPLNGGDDCNDNSIEDSYDWAGYIPRGPYPLGSRPHHLAAGHLRNTHKYDLAIANEFGDNSVSVLLQRLSRGFTTAATESLSSTPACIATGDIDADGDTDIITAHAGASAIEAKFTLLRNTGSGEDFDKEDYDISSNATFNRGANCVATADLNGGGLDLVTTSGVVDMDSTVTLFSNGDLSHPQHKEIHAAPGELAIQDFDGDSDLDVCLLSAARFSCMRNDPDTDFDSWPHFSSHISGTAISAGQLDENRGPDIAIVSGNHVKVLLRHAGGWCDSPAPSSACSFNLFADAVDHDLGEDIGDIAIADLDADDDNDIVVTLPDSDRVAFLWNNGDGNFLNASGTVRLTYFPVYDAPNGLLTGDLDQDGRVEVAITNEDSGDLWVLHRRSSPVSMPGHCLSRMFRPARN